MMFEQLTELLYKYVDPKLSANLVTSNESLCDVNAIKSEVPDKYMISITIENKKVITEFDTLSSMSLKQFQQLKKSYFKEMSKCVLTLEKLLN